MSWYLESGDDTQGYAANLFCTKTDLVHDQTYTLTELGFRDWLKIPGSKKPQKKLIARFYGVKNV